LNSGKFFSKGRARYKSKRKKKGTSDIKKRDERYKKKDEQMKQDGMEMKKKGQKTSPWNWLIWQKISPWMNFELQ